MQFPKPPTAPTPYFQQRKKGEMNELKNLLNKSINEQDSKKAREVVKKIIGYMTLGMDASPVFSQMCRASFTNDEITKKMIYFYLTTYAQDNADLAIMAVNTFQKDCKHSSSKIRGLALRNLCSFKTADYVNNVLPTIRQLLLDHQPYVKKTAIMGILKVFYHDPPTIFQDEGIISTLSQLIRDHDSLVSVNAVLALEQIFVSQGGIPLSPKLVKYLYNRLKQYNGWAQSQILQILYKYDPKDQRQHYDIMTNLWQKLKQSSTSLVLSSIRIIIKLAKQKQQLFNDVVEKIKAPLLTLMSANQMSGTFETIYIILQHIQYVICHMDGKKFYQRDFKYFYIKNDEPTYIKLIKVKILGQLANEYNLGDMLNELNQYATENDEEIARKSIEVISDIALSLPQVSKALLINLIAFYKSEKPHLTNSSMTVFSKILKKYPKLFADLQPVLLSIDKNLICQPASTKSFIWILGNFGNQIQAAPYLLQQYMQQQENFQKWSDSIKSVYLTSLVQIFVKRPPQAYKMLAKAFGLILNNDNSSMLIRDHATFYYRALKDNVQEVKRGFSVIQNQYSKNIKQKNRLSALLQSNIRGPQSSITNLSTQSKSQDVFNNLSLIFRKRQNKFIKSYNYFMTMRNKELGLVEPVLEDEEQNEDVMYQNGHQQFNNQGVGNGDIEMLIDVSRPLEATDFEQDFAMTAEEFQQTWNSLQQHDERQYTTDNQEYLNQQSVEELFKMWYLNCMASISQDEDAMLKFFMYGKHTSGDLFCMELTIDKSEKKLTMLTKAKTEKIASLLNDYVSEFLGMNDFVIAK